MTTQREYVELELQDARRQLANVTDPGRQVAPSPAGRDYRKRLEEDISELQKRLSDLEAE